MTTGALPFLAVGLLASSPDAGAIASLLEWFDIDEPWRLWLVVFGLTGQVVFFVRWVVQWIASEARGESHVPEAFWWCSLVGASMLLTYFVLDRDPVGIVGQATGWAIYLRNLVLVHRKRRRMAEGRSR